MRCNIKLNQRQNDSFKCDLWENLIAKIYLINLIYNGKLTSVFIMK